MVQLPSVAVSSYFKVALPLLAAWPAMEAIKEFRPDIIHAHHPFLMGDTALIAAARLHKPLVFTHHTMYEDYTHYYLPASKRTKRFIMHLPTGFANLCDCVFAPTSSVADTLKQRGVTAPVETMPTGIDADFFKEHSEGSSLRKRLGIPSDAFVAGYVGRVSKEKNMFFWLKSVMSFLKNNQSAHALLAGDGRLKGTLQRAVGRHGLRDRIHLVGPFRKEQLPAVYNGLLARTNRNFLPKVQVAGLWRTARRTLSAKWNLWSNKGFCRAFRAAKEKIQRALPQKTSSEVSVTANEVVTIQLHIREKDVN